MEQAHVNSGVPRADDCTHRVLCFDMRLHAQGQAPSLWTAAKRCVTSLCGHERLFLDSMDACAQHR